ncbi:MAG: acyl-CoA dehydratase activase [Planctomycetota bacterium]|nr:acyl-CoA dehydratase activase [Planctomycetota bacterium]
MIAKRPGTFRLGLDLGSAAAKAALLDDGDSILALRLDVSGRPPGKILDDLYLDLSSFGDLSGIAVVATGYGRSLVERADRRLTEITCHARGVRMLHPDARSILDVGGQDAKAIRLGPDGRVDDFAMNDRCAAGTGRFLEMAARRHGLAIGELSAFCGHTPLAGEGGNAVEITATCAVFAESEMVGLAARGTPAVETLRAAHRAVARRVALLLKQVGAEEPLYFTGGAAANAALAAAVSAESGLAATPAGHAQFAGALGAALFARREN